MKRVLKKTFISFTFLVFALGINAQTLQNYSIKAEFLYGTILEHNVHLKDLVKGPSVGGALSLEWQTMGEKNWHNYLNFPVIGVSATFMDMGNPEMLGNVIALYPYLQVPIFRTKYISLNMRPGAGVAFATKYYENSPHQEGTLNGINGERNGANAAIGSMLNVFLCFGGNIEVPVTNGISLTADYAWNHISNGSVIQPNSGINMMNAYAGLKYRPNHKSFSLPEKRNVDDISRKIQVELSLAGGVRELYYKDNKKYPIGAVALSAYKPLNNWYRMGLGIDAFYDGVFGAVNHAENPTDNTTEYQRTYITSDKLSNKIRVGTSWQHEFIMGRFTGGFHFGLYLYDPIKNLEPIKDRQLNARKKGLIYPYNIDVEDGWFYTRATAKYSITDHIFASVGLKTHLQKAEFIEWGLGYRF